jgi:hypothetical protein
MSENRKHIRRLAGEKTLIYDRTDDQLIGEVINMSNNGVLLKTEKPYQIPGFLWCRLQLSEKLLGRDQIEFDLEVKRCQKMESEPQADNDDETDAENENVDYYAVGCQLMNVPKGTRNVIKALTNLWMAKHSDHMNENSVSFKK